MKAIETRYKGYQFRSRLEARYAVFFDALDIDWEYEKEGFELGALGRYLPDFFLRFKPSSGAADRHSGAGYWLEVKGEFPTLEECTKMRALCMMTKHHGAIFYGAPGKHVPIVFQLSGRVYCGLDGPTSAKDIQGILAMGPSTCDATFDTVHAQVLCVARNKGWADFADAFAAARSARFEFGQSGATK
jgi:hypothetical protein